ncbi:GntR family transcriptional regulator [Cellulomonas sp. DKR-3]|uniref:GntR family transcriptional regulator n=1 Tax=Cellulomonas fulva TaxID=2835530 RepID=A0ABS5TW58_9CELL|nr:GntR family transcriptional regulator [Cellulomonas fulva]MBT0993337.1 GntR family transcriptional regulator [Cellulomonas fulva]
MPIPARTAAAQPGRTLLADVVHDRLLAVVVSGELAPGEVVREEEIAAWLSVSRTPVREALRRLGDQGLLRCQPNRGSHVAPLEADYLDDVVEVVAALDGVAAARAELDTAALAEIGRHLDRAADAQAAGEPGARAEHVRDALDALHAHAANPVLAATVHALRPHLLRLVAIVPDPAGADDARDRAGALLTALTTADAGDATRAWVQDLARPLVREAVRLGIGG